MATVPRTKVYSVAELQHRNSKAKRKLNPLVSQVETAKWNMNTGKPYRSRNGNFKSGILPPQQAKACHPCDKPGCTLPLATKLEVFSAYWKSMDSHDKKSAFLMSSIEIKIPKNRTALAPLNRIQNVYGFSFLHQGVKLEMCKTGFMHMLQIKERPIRTVISKMKAGDYCIRDQRGRHDNRPNRIPAASTAAVDAHFRSFPAYESHYTRTRGNPQRLYLEPSLNVAKMYSLYIESCRHNNTQALEVEPSYYRTIFLTFKLAFGSPKQDTCDTCDKYRIQIEANPVIPNPISLARDLHQHQATLTYRAYRMDKERAKIDANYIVLSEDLEQVIFTPNLKHNLAFYLRKLSNYNLGIHNSHDDSCQMTLWAETTAGRGSNEVASCLWNYCVSRFAVLIQAEERELVIWSDRCTGQNNNFIVLTMLTLLVRHGLFSKVSHKFLLTGHSYNDCDRDCGNLETKLKVSSVMVPSDIEDVVRNARPENPFTCHWLTANSFKNFKAQSNLYNRPTSLKVTSCLWFEYNRDSLDRIFTRETHTTGVWCMHKLELKSGNPIGNFNPNSLRPAYHDSIPLLPSKVADHEKLLPFLRENDAAFYEYIILENTGAF